LDKNPLNSIAAVQRETGLGKDTLRVWERRYGFPMPQRDAHGERVYSADDLDKLRMIKRLLDAGHRPGGLMALSNAELRRLGARVADASIDAPADAQLREWLGLLRVHDLSALRQQLRQAQQRLGLTAFVIKVIAPFNTLIGDAWMRGTLDVYQEHSYTETVHRVLRSGIQGLPEAPVARNPHMLFSTLPGEPHGIGLLMAEAVCAAHGAHCSSLGVQTPVAELVMAAESYRVDVLALSFTACLGARLVLRGLADLRRALPASGELWAGGSAPALHRPLPAGVRALHTLEELPTALHDWRERQGLHPG
jgi:DNA-binding transcriptional MerR regulator